MAGKILSRGTLVSDHLEPLATLALESRLHTGCPGGSDSDGRLGLAVQCAEAPALLPVALSIRRVLALPPKARCRSQSSSSNRVSSVTLTIPNWQHPARPPSTATWTLRLLPLFFIPHPSVFFSPPLQHVSVSSETQKAKLSSTNSSLLFPFISILSLRSPGFHSCPHDTPSLRLPASFSIPDTRGRLFKPRVLLLRPLPSRPITTLDHRPS